MIQLPPPTISTAEDLLVQFEQTGDTAPFEEIVRRYSGMVYGVCYRVTRNAHDAEDATQATFLKLATYARTGFGTRGDSDRMSEPGRPPRVGPWLQQVAKTTSVDLRRSKTRRQNREQIRAAIEDQQQPRKPTLLVAGRKHSFVLSVHESRSAGSSSLSVAKARANGAVLSMYWQFARTLRYRLPLTSSEATYLNLFSYKSREAVRECHPMQTATDFDRLPSSTTPRLWFFSHG